MECGVVGGAPAVADESVVKAAVHADVSTRR